MHPDKSASNRQRLQLRGTETLSPRVKQHHPLHFLELGTWIKKKVNRFRVHLHYINTIITSIYFQLYVLYFTCLLFSRMHLSVCWSVTLLLFFIGKSTWVGSSKVREKMRCRNFLPALEQIPCDKYERILSKCNEFHSFLAKIMSRSFFFFKKIV